MARRALVALVLSLFAIGAPAQSIFTMAGGGSDDGRPATLTGLSYPNDVAVDMFGNLYIADTYSNRIRRVK